jgi:hypothetical protein
LLWSAQNATRSISLFMRDHPDWMGWQDHAAKAEARKVDRSFREIGHTPKSPIFMDDEVIGFGVQVRETAAKECPT